uniref:RanBP2-type domain-containing protein n=1 Tax=Oryza meridionalis TaxID=40149 RepID=A0A0E0C3H7_9ORYZ
MEAKAAAMAMRKPGDWSCRSCQYVNFCKREACQRCGEAKLGVERTDYAAMGGGWEVKPGDWCCRCCGVNNYASRGSCFKCGAAKNDSAAAVAQGWGFSVASQAGWKNGDWICPRMECNVQNYANRTECFRCNFPRYYG